MDVDVIKSYLVSLGFEVNQPELRKFQDSIETVAKEVERFTVGAYGIASLFVKAGLAIGTTLTAIATGTVAMMDEVAQADLGYQIFARRMFMSADAAKSLKIATDALGYSLEDIIWGPKELQERFGLLTEDQKKMAAGLGGDFEKQMRQIRDIRFEFTRLGVELQYFWMNLTKSISKALFGDEDSLLKKLREMNDYFIQHMPEIADAVAQYLVPILKDVASIFHDLWSVAQEANIKRIGSAIVIVADALARVIHYIAEHPILQHLLAAGAGATVGAALGGLPGAALGGLAGGFGYKFATEGDSTPPTHSTPSDDIRAKARAVAEEAARRTGIDASYLYGQMVHETGNFTNRGATDLNNLAGITNPGGRAFGYRSFNSLDEFADFYAKLLMSPRYAGARGAHNLEGYVEGLKQGGWYTDSEDNYMRGVRRGAAQYSPTSAGVTINGGIQVHVNNPNANPDDVYKATIAAVDARLNKQTQRNILQFSGVYA